LIKTIFQGALRISEALSLTPNSIQRFNGRQPVLEIIGKGRKRRVVAIPQRLVDQLRAFAFEKGLGPNDRFFKINRSQAWRVITKAAKKTGFTKRVHPHLFRHSGSIERLRQTGNPKSLQMFLGHSSPQMTLKYLSTLSSEDSIAIEGQVEFE
jgi:integrase/recombinase XerD